MRLRRGLTVLTAACALAAAVVVAAPVSAGSARVVQRVTITTPAGRAGADSSQTSSAQPPPLLKLSRRSRVTFTVAHDTIMFPLFLDAPTEAGRFVAFYLPATGDGLAIVPDAGSVRHWPAVLSFGDGGFTKLTPHHTYTMLVAMDHAATVRMPMPMHVVSVHASAFAADVVIHPIALAAPGVAAVDWTADPIGRFHLSTTAIALDWNSDPSPVADMQGDACHSSSPVVSCAQSSSSYLTETIELGGSNARRVIFGEGYDRPAAMAYISGYAANAPTPFDAATLYGFGMDLPAG